MTIFLYRTKRNIGFVSHSQILRTGPLINPLIKWNLRKSSIGAQKSLAASLRPFASHSPFYVCTCVCLLQVAMQRAKVCVRSVSMSGKSHMRLVKGKDAQPEIADHEAAYRDNTGEDVCVHSAQPTRRASGWQQEAPSCWLRHVLPSALINSRHMCGEKAAYCSLRRRRRSVLLGNARPHLQPQLWPSKINK